MGQAYAARPSPIVLATWDARLWRAGDALGLALLPATDPSTGPGVPASG